MIAPFSPRPTLVVTVALAVLAAGCSGGGPSSAREGAAGAQGTQAGDTALAQTIPSPGPPGPSPWSPSEAITVNGTGRITGSPDTLRATVGVEVQRPAVQEALDAANAAVDQVLTALEEAGVADDDLQTMQFSVHPQYRHREGQPPEITGYVVTNLVEAKIRDLDNVGAVLSQAVSAGGDAARVQGIAFALEDNAALLADARAAAFADARSKAEQYAELAGVELGELLSISEVNADLPPPVAYGDTAAMEESARGAAAPVPVRPGSQEVAVTVTASWDL